jgi:hypothetical protein
MSANHNVSRSRNSPSGRPRTGIQVSPLMPREVDEATTKCWVLALVPLIDTRQRNPASGKVVLRVD